MHELNGSFKSTSIPNLNKRIMAIFNQYYPKDYFEKGVPSDIKSKAKATCIVCAVGQKFFNPSGPSLTVKTSGYYYDITDPRYPDGGNGKLCDAIANEKAVWMTGTAFAIGQSKFITAKHVVADVLAEVDAKPSDFKKLKLMSGYFLQNSPSSPFKYEMLDVTAIDFHPDKDICTITTKQKMQNYFNVAPTTELRALKVNDPLQMVGYPLGQPMKYTEGIVATVDGALDDFNGYISLFPGNSGSPVINAKTGNVVGILVSGSQGMTDWILINNCYGYRTYANNQGQHAGIIYASNFE